MVEAESQVILIKKITNAQKWILPLKAKTGDTCFDFVYWEKDPIKLKPFERALVPLGFALEMPSNIELQIRSKSGLAINKGLIVLNSPGSIDSSFTGEVKAIMINLSNEDITINYLDKICQGKFSNVLDISLKLVDDIHSTERGSAGFGSTGSKADV